MKTKPFSETGDYPEHCFFKSKKSLPNASEDVSFRFSEVGDRILMVFSLPQEECLLAFSYDLRESEELLNGLNSILDGGGPRVPFPFPPGFSMTLSKSGGVLMMVNGDRGLSFCALDYGFEETKELRDQLAKTIDELKHRMTQPKILDA
jgi:hypothetical protein